MSNTYRPRPTPRPQRRFRRYGNYRQDYFGTPRRDRLDELALRNPGRSDAWLEDGGANDEGWDDYA